MPKNITNGEFIINYNEEDKVDENYKFIRAPTNDSIDILKNDKQKISTNYYIESRRLLIKIFERASLHKYLNPT